MLQEVNGAEKNRGKFKGKRFWCGAFDLADGHVVEVHTYQTAEANDFHHSLYFSPRIDIDGDRYGFFWIDEHGKVNTAWRNDRAPSHIERAIREQVEIVSDEGSRLEAALDELAKQHALDREEVKKIAYEEVAFEASGVEIPKTGASRYFIEKLIRSIVKCSCLEGYEPCCKK